MSGGHQLQLAALWPWLLMATLQAGFGHTGLVLAAAVESERSAEQKAIIRVIPVKMDPTGKLNLTLEGVFAGVAEITPAEGKLMQSDGDDFNYIIAFFLGTAACLYQCYLLVYYTSWRNVKSFLTLGLICLCNMYLYELRNLWQLFFHVTVAAFVTLQIWLRQAQGKAPDYDV